ncbi:hypothetical protein D3C73_1030940 [compost metagenome]
MDRAQLGMTLQVQRRAHRVDLVVHQRLAVVAVVALDQLADDQVRVHTVFHGQEVLRDHQVQVDLGVRFEKARQPGQQQQVGERLRAAQGYHMLGIGVAADALRRLGDVGEG